jgi:predicted CXXCH cytochrome family protein
MRRIGGAMAGPIALSLLILASVGAKPAKKTAAQPLHPYRTIPGITSTMGATGHAGDCDQCHTMHGAGPVVYGHALVGPNENSLCDRCHDTPWSAGSYGGTDLYMGSSHAAGPGTIWPGPSPPPRTEAGAAGKCLNCHDPHGWTDGSGLIPMLAIGREEGLCLTCHDGSPATTNIGIDIAKPYAHPVSLVSGIHTGPMESTPQDFGVNPANKRHAECADCHDPHVATVDRGGIPAAPELPRVNLGVSRVLVQNGGPGAPPAFVFVPGSDTLTAPRAEYQLCFKCHSSWTNQPTGQTDLALALNPANASYHPVEAPGRNLGIQPNAFVPGWSASSLTRCGDCHGSDFPGSPRGPHGSSYRYILKQPYEASSQPRRMTSDEMCFACHSYDVYGNPASPAATLMASRFNPPGATAGHAAHTDQNVPCFACHVTHGAAFQPQLIATGRVPGIVAFTETPSGGTCTPTCHAPQSYTVGYAR